MSRRRLVPGLALGACLLLAAGCGPGAATVGSPPTPYAGPMSAAPSAGVDLWDDPGAAGAAVDCDHTAIGGTSTTPYTGGEVGETPEDALEQAQDEGIWDGLPRTSMRLVRSEPDRMLYAYAADGRTKQAVILRHGPAAVGTGAGRDGVAWWVESWARCDLAEYPAEVAEEHGIELWTGPDGRRVPVRTVSSHEGTDCVDGMRFLELGSASEDPAKRRVYVAHSELHPDYFAEQYREGVPLPGDAVDSGYSRDGEHVWFSRDARRAYVGDADRVDLWPRTVQELGCA